jgi:DNA-binding GntR family transcriptional regulator
MEALEESLDFMRFYTERGDAKRMRSINANFHKLIASASQNRMLIESLSRIQDYIRYSSRVLPLLKTDLPVLLKEHKVIYASFKSNDPEAGAIAMKKHIENSMKRANI